MAGNSTTSSPTTIKSSNSTKTSVPTSSSRSRPSPSAANGISRGTAAGIAIGCAVAGALIAACIVFILMRRKRKRRPRRAYSLRQKPATPPQQAKGNTTPTHPHPGVFALAESSLPQPLEDAAIGGEMSKLQTLIKNFVHSYYHSSHVTGKSQGLSALGANPSIPIATLAAMLRDPRKSAAAMRYCIAWTIFSRVGFDRRDSISLLPPRVVGCIQLISDDSKGKDSTTLAAWRALTHYFLSEKLTTSDTVSTNAEPVQAAVSDLVKILEPYATSDHDMHERMTKLEAIVKRGASFGWLIFGQISCFRFVWEARNRGEVCIFPVLLQTMDEKGKMLPDGGKLFCEGEDVKVERL